ncbi:MAG TPA: sigma 54-interacting transcriptional regulator [Vicinamibacterales bacterium]|nr:sigma 54-interacting transcriptional regulator [Vicinamibacterales bacterium]
MEDTGTSAAAHLSRYDALARTSKTLASHRTTTELFEVLADNLHRIVPFDYLALVLHDDSTDEMRLVELEPAEKGFPFVSMPVAEQGPAAIAWQTQKAAVIPIPEDGPVHPVLEAIRNRDGKMTCWLPLTTARRRVGVLSFGSRSSKDYTDDVIAFMEQVAATVAIAVDNGINWEQAQHLQRELREERDRLRLLLDVNNLLVSHLAYPELIKAIGVAVKRVVEHDHISISLYDEDAGLMRFHWRYDERRGLVASDFVAPLERSAGGVALQRGAVCVFSRAELDSLELHSATWMREFGLETICCVPLVIQNRKLGALNVASAEPNAFSQDDVAMLGHTATPIALALGNARAYDQITHVNAQLSDEKEYLERELSHEFSEIVGASRALRKVLEAVKTVAPTDSTVLLLGETGTGKELIARAVHRHSARRDRTFVRMSVAALPASLFESELFGHEKGAFTGATQSRIGRLELANRGTLFLDEVGDIPMEIQPKFLRVLQEREFERLGSTRTQRVDVRVVAATNRNLAKMAEDESFRSDLYYRLNVFPILIPPLRDRTEDIPALAQHFARQYSRRMGRPVPAISEPVMSALKRWTWPGNIRELQNVIERAVILSPGPTLVLPLQDVQPGMHEAPAAAEPVPASGAVTFQDAERKAIIRALRDSNGIVSGAATRLGLKRTTLQSKMHRLGIRRPSF